MRIRACDIYQQTTNCTRWAPATVHRWSASRLRTLFHGHTDAPVRLHRIRNDQLYHRYLGDPIEVLMLHENGTSERAIVGPDLRAGQCVQLLIPGNTFHTARVIGDRRWFLGASTEWPGVERVDVEIGDVEALAIKYPEVADDLRAFQRGRGD